MTVPSAPPGPRDTRFKLPVEAPLTSLLIASLAAIAGGFQLFAWALARLPTFFLWFGLLLTGTGLGIALAALIRQRLLHWVAYVGPESFTVRRGSRTTLLPWVQVGAVVLQGSHLRVVGSSGGRTLSLLVDRTREAHDAARGIVQAAEVQLRSRS